MVDAALNIAESQQPTVLVLGAGATGASCARYFAARGVVAMFADTRKQPSGQAAIEAAMPDAELLHGMLPHTLPAGIEQIVISPGLQIPAALLSQARAAGVSVVSDIDLFLAEEAGTVLLITGSNGKSTVTSLLNHLLCEAGRASLAGGNIGVPALDLLAQPHDTAVLELSSFQLERSAPPVSAIAAVLNFAVDHLDQHGSMENYRAAKLRIFDRCQTAVVNRAEPRMQAPAGTATISFGLDVPEEGHWGVSDSHIVFGATDVIGLDELPVRGTHNALNVLAAFAMAHASGVALAELAAAVKSFKALPHRMQPIATADGVHWINDSKATNEAAAAASVRSVNGELILIAGGDGKGSDFAGLADALAGRQAQVLVFGQDAARLQEALSEVCPVQQVADLESAVAAARAKAKPGATVLLAPACASLDMFASYADRGDRFMNLVAQELLSGVKQ